MTFWIILCAVQFCDRRAEFLRSEASNKVLVTKAPIEKASCHGEPKYFKSIHMTSFFKLANAFKCAYQILPHRNHSWQIKFWCRSRKAVLQQELSWRWHSLQGVGDGERKLSGLWLWQSSSRKTFPFVHSSLSFVFFVLSDLVVRLGITILAVAFPKGCWRWREKTFSTVAVEIKLAENISFC